jgi:hypothetical protein
MEGSTTFELYEEWTHASAYMAAGTASRLARDVLVTKLVLSTALPFTHVNNDPARIEGLSAPDGPRTRGLSARPREARRGV